jgi:hypothetical protein
MKKLKHSKYKNTGILFEMLVRKLTSETLTSNKSVTIDIIKKYFGKNTELAKELQLYNALVKEQFRSEAQGLDYIRTIKNAYAKLNQSILKRQKYNLVKEISEKFVFSDLSKIHINNYKALASIYMLFEYEETDNPKQLLECKNVILDNGLIVEKKSIVKDPLMESFESQPKEIRLLTYKLLVDKFNDKYSTLSDRQKLILKEFINNITNTTKLREFVNKNFSVITEEITKMIPSVSDKTTQIKLAEVITLLQPLDKTQTVKDENVISLLQYYQLIEELKSVK